MRRFLSAILAGFMATLVMTAVMLAGRFYLGTPFIAELIAQGLFATYYPEGLFLGSGEMALAILIHLLAGAVLGALFINLLTAFELRNRFMLSLLYSIALWFIFSSFFLPVLGFGFFGKYFPGIPAAAEASLLVSFLVYGFVLSLLHLDNPKNGI